MNPSVFAPQRLNWYRMSGSRTYHRQTPDWVQTGKALCGANIARPGWVATYDNATAEPQVKLCKRCLKKV